MAVLCAETTDSARNKTVARLVKDMQAKNDDTKKHVALLVLGELGRQTDLSRVKNLQVRGGQAGREGGGGCYDVMYRRGREGVWGKGVELGS